MILNTLGQLVEKAASPPTDLYVYDEAGHMASWCVAKGYAAIAGVATAGVIHFPTLRWRGA